MSLQSKASGNINVRAEQGIRQHKCPCRVGHPATLMCVQSKASGNFNVRAEQGIRPVTTAPHYGHLKLASPVIQDEMFPARAVYPTSNLGSHGFVP
ncbi:sulfotransferase [Plakobranchus ocellatus]|uniref:Sulfotransferase n=1 Tax=Plakobranchus ocellatus TaxID=259542 RepID=A0AAV4C4X4_9GAST|nr:sulfotransferase [Plakobranchus ocellatus]